MSTDSGTEIVVHRSVHVPLDPEKAFGTRVDLRHRHLERYGDQAGTMRAAFDSPGGWAGILNRFVDLVT